MKYAIRIFALLAAVVMLLGALSGCSGDPILGTWKATTGAGGLGKITIEFRGDGTCTFADRECNWERNGDNKIVLSGDALKGISASGTIDFTNLRIEDNRMHFFSSFDQVAYTMEKQ
ncbi:MAG: hypothetical protein NC299_10615 [Lachnospiraceae bacterium]|nr:hypothetical protein [Ruminococcus sp.]MCM1275800.1 hypothetical protein [Lachnospiraceae bacterium]